MLEAGQILSDRYQLVQELGQNAGRRTWLATDLSLHPPQPVVIKLLSFSDQVQWDYVRLFEREAQTLRQLHHPRIPKYRDYFSIDDRVLWFGLVQAYIPGASLKECLLRGRKFSEEEIRQLATEVLEILIYLHTLSPAVLHRDIKPSNLIWGDDNHIYLVDFGAVQDRTVSEGASFTVVGTYGYAPLEQFGGRAVPASDLYALGATLVHLITGTPPANLPQQNMRIRFADRVSLSPDLVQWIEKLIEPAVEQRFATASQALEALQMRISILSPAVKLYPSLQYNNSGAGMFLKPLPPVPDEIKGWNWGAFCMPWLWCIGNGVWIGLLCFVPTIGWFMAIALGIKGNEWAWRSKRWRSIEQFKANQRGWAIASIIVGIPVSLMLWGATIAMFATLL